MNKKPHSKSQRQHEVTLNKILKLFDSLSEPARQSFWLSIPESKDARLQVFSIQRKMLIAMYSVETRQVLENRLKSMSKKEKQLKKKASTQSSLCSQKSNKDAANPAGKSAIERHNKEKGKKKMYPYGMPEGTPQFGEKRRPKLLSGGGANGTGKKR